MRTQDFYYDLPAESIAQEPMKRRDRCRLLVLRRDSGTLEHCQFSDLPGLLQPGDRLILNNTKVLNARLYCRKTTGAKVELLFVERLTTRKCRVMANPGRRLKAGARLLVEKKKDIMFEVNEICDNGDRILSLSANRECNTVSDVLRSYGVMPLPPYIHRHAGKRDSVGYQTVYASKEGAVAAPTAGLHFTNRLINTLKSKGIGISDVTLHVGPGTFAPVKESDPRQHRMQSERYELSCRACSELQRTSERGGRNIAVGTTVVRVLEHCASQVLPLKPGHGTTDLMILPPYDFRMVDGLITNFHLPCSTLLMLVSAFGGRKRILAAYEEAIKRHYRFYSYGDAMLVL